MARGRPAAGPPTRWDLPVSGLLCPISVSPFLLCDPLLFFGLRCDCDPSENRTSWRRLTARLRRSCCCSDVPDNSVDRVADTKHAEKEYLKRTGSTVWERTKPFSPAGSDTLDDSAHLLHDFAAAMPDARPSPDDLILDLGAGACWCSDLLGRLNRSSIAVDISHDMLAAGRARGTAIRAVTGDMESLPFKSGVFQQAICLSAIHHVPDIRAAVGRSHVCSTAAASRSSRNRDAVMPTHRWPLPRCATSACSNRRSSSTISCGRAGMQASRTFE